MVRLNAKQQTVFLKQINLLPTLGVAQNFLNQACVHNSPSGDRTVLQKYKICFNKIEKRMYYTELKTTAVFGGSSKLSAVLVGPLFPFCQGDVCCSVYIFIFVIFITLQSFVSLLPSYLYLYLEERSSQTF